MERSLKLADWYAEEIYRIDKELRQLHEDYDNVGYLAKLDIERNITKARKYLRTLYDVLGIKWKGDLL